MTVADFFCGAGGFSEGFRQNGFKIEYALDNWKPAIDTHELNHPDCINDHRNILEFDTPEKIDGIIPDTDIIIGSPPCVAFSGSNKAGKADKSLGIRLIETFLRIVAWKKKKGTLKYWVLENVPNSKDYIKDEYTFEELGLPGKGIALNIKERHILNAADYGAPQTRRRFVCGDYPVPETTHEKSGWITMSDVMNDLGNPLDGPKGDSTTDPVHGFRLATDKLTDHFYHPIVSELEWKRARRLKEDHGFMGKMSFPEDLNRPSRTVMATMSASTRESIIFEAKKDNKTIGYRLPTIREISTFMGFPINYQFSGNSESVKYRQVGNAVCIPLSSALAKAILTQENIPIPDYISLPYRRPDTDLKGIKRIPKIPKPKKSDAKFSVHIPYLKVRSFRVELSNKDSDFENGDIRWKSILHNGSGKNAKSFEISQELVEKWLPKEKDVESFKDIVAESFRPLRLSHSGLQENYVLNGACKDISPEESIGLMKELIDKNLKDERWISKDDMKDKINRDSIPLRILAGLYACNHFVNNLK